MADLELITRQVSTQDLVNQLRKYEDDLSNFDYPRIANATGKQSPGGGATVCITLELVNNWRIQFEARAGPETNLLYLIESLVGKNKILGNIWYWNPTSGNNASDGTTPATAILTFAQAQTLATAGNNDIVFTLGTVSGGITTVTEAITLTKNNLKLREPGYTFQIKPSVNTTVPVTFTADNNEISGFYIEPASGGSVNGITVTGDNALIKDCWINSATANGIDISSSTRTTIQTCAIETSGSNGINIENSTSKCLISTSIISGSGSDGVNISGSAITDNIFDAVWNEVIAGHVTSDTVGRTLKDAKTKATLASLK